MGKTTLCAIPECGIVGTKGRGLCRAHYNRWYRTGDAGTAEIAPYERSDGCRIEGCAGDNWARSLCHMHYERWRTTGDPGPAGGIHAERVRRGDSHPEWLGDEAGYMAMHERTRKARGKAAAHFCPCGDMAAHWAYDHEDINERRDGNGRVYSLDVNHYIAMCVPCHRRFDSDQPCRWER